MEVQKLDEGTKIELFKSLFRGREDVYGTYSLSNGQSHQIKEAITDEVIEAHLNGISPLGKYPLSPDSDKIWWACLDVDREDFNIARMAGDIEKRLGLYPYIERSKSRRFHIWNFFPKNEPVPAWKIRLILKELIAKEIKAEYDYEPEIFPKQDSLDGIEYGNFVNLPLFKRLIEQERTVFVDEDNHPYPDQWSFLASIERISEAKLDDIIEINELSRETPKTTTPSAGGNGNYKNDLPPCAKAIFDNGVDEGCRDVCGFRLAIHFRKKGIPQEAVRSILSFWNEKNRPPLEDKIIAQKAISAFKQKDSRYAYTSYGCHNPLISQFCDDSCPIYQKQIKKSDNTAKVKAETIEESSIDEMIEEAKSIEDEYERRKAVLQVIQERISKLGVIDKDYYRHWLNDKFSIELSTFDKVIAEAEKEEKKEAPKPQVIPTKDIQDEEFHLTDWGNAQRLVQLHGKDIRYNSALGWLYWDGTRWKRDDSGELERRAKDTVRNIYIEAGQASDSARRKELASYAISSESNRKIKDMISLAQSEPRIPIASDMLDTDPFLLNVKNGTIDLRTGDFREHRREDYLTKMANAEYDPEAECPLWLSFLDRIMKGNKNLIDFLQRLFGYCLTGDVSEQILPIFHGSGENGKSTSLETIKYIEGDYGFQLDPSSLMLKRFETIRNDLARLQGIRFCPSIEVDKGRQLAESLAKQITGGEAIVARFLYHEYFEFYPQFKIILATNHKPIIRGTDHAIWRRIKLVPFEYKFPEEERDRNFREKYLNPEASGILNWLIKGCLEWQASGLRFPEEVKKATREYCEEMDILANFITECCLEDPIQDIFVKDLYQIYLQWCSENKEYPIGKRDFNSRLREKGFVSFRGVDNVLTWRGIGVLPNLFSQDKEKDQKDDILS